MRRLIERFEGPLAAYIGATVLLIGAVSVYWDIATHIDIGRERFLTPAHIGIYSSVLISAIGVALSGLADHFKAGDSFLAALRHPFRGLRPGIGVAGAGLLTTLAAAPFDNLWHEIYGVDVTIWSPPHLLAIFGIAAAALGLAALMAPAVTGENNAFFPLHLTAFLTTLLVTTAEFEFNAPQYRIAYHPLVLAAVSSLVFTAAAGPRWRATKVALWFEVVRVVSFLFLLAMGRSVAFVPILVPAAIAADLLPRDRARGTVTGLAVAAATLASNWAVLELLPGLRWPLDDVALGTPFALAAGAMFGWLGWRLGTRLDGQASAKTASIGPRRAPAVALLSAFAVLVATPALAHEVGGRRGAGTIEWTPKTPEAGQPFDVRISDLVLDSGEQPADVHIEAWRAEHRISEPLPAGVEEGSAQLTLPEQGQWFLFVRTESGGENLLWGGRFTVAEEGAGETGVSRRRFTLGVDTVAGKESAAWVDAVAYGIAMLILLLLVRGVLRALARLPHPSMTQEVGA